MHSTTIKYNSPDYAAMLVLLYSEDLQRLQRRFTARIAELMPPNSETELELVSDSVEYLAYTIEYIGYRDKLDQAF